MRILIVKTSSLGDVIHMLPAVTDAMHAVPGIEIDWVVEEAFASIPAWHPAVRRVIPVALRRWRTRWWSPASWGGLLGARRAIRAQEYDFVVDAQGLYKSALWTRWARGVRCGHDSTTAREPGATRFYQRRFPVPTELHAIQRNRVLLAAVLAYPIHDVRPDYGLGALAERLGDPGLVLPENYVLALHGTSRVEKEWPVESWMHLARVMAGQGRPLVLPWGSEDERSRAEAIAAAAPGTVVLPRLDLDGLALVTTRALAVIGVDTGLMHLAAALGKPGLALYPATQPQLTGVVPDRHSRRALINLDKPEHLAPDVVAGGLLALLETL